MKSRTSDLKLIRIVVGIVLSMLALLPFHAFLTVWLASATGHYTLLRLWKEFLLSIVTLKALYLLWGDKQLRQRLLSWKLTWLITMFAGVQLLWGVAAYHLHTVSGKALAYGWLLDLRFLVFFLAVWILASRTEMLRRYWQPAIIWPLIVVCTAGLVQYFLLPYDALKHFGYSDHTIFPYETINHNIHYVRVMSTLRGANPLGAYLVLVMSLLVALWQRQKRWLFALLMLPAALVLVLTFSRSAWIGLALSVGALLAVGLHSPQSRRLTAALAGSAVVAAAFAGLALRHSTVFQNTFLHTQDRSTVATSSNQGHASALRSGLHDLLHQPLGRGPGSAGPASVYNNHPARISENFFVQIGQEIGWLGLIIFIMINVNVGRLLWLRRQDPLALGLFAALIGLTFVNFLSHAWTDDTLAYIFWGLAGIALATKAVKPKTGRT